MNGSDTISHTPTSLHSVYLVARREFVVRVRSRVYRIGTALMVLLLIGYVVLQTRVLNNRTSVTTVGFTSSVLLPNTNSGRSN